MGKIKAKDIIIESLTSAIKELTAENEQLKKGKETFTFSDKKTGVTYTPKGLRYTHEDGFTWAYCLASDGEHKHILAKRLFNPKHFEVKLKEPATNAGGI